MSQSSTIPSAPMVDTTFQIAGLDCPDELETIERRLRRLSGVGELYPNYVSRTLRVEFDAAQCDPQSIAAAIREVGFEARREGEPAAPQSWWNRHHRVVLLGAAAMLLVSAAVVHWTEVAGFAPLLVLLAASTLAGGYHVARSGLAALARGIVDMNLLMTVAAAGAFVLALRYFKLPFEAATVMCLFSLALWLETLSLDRARHAIHRLMQIAPAQALRIREDGEVEAVDAAVVRAGDRLQVRPGDKIAVDGVVREGRSSVNESPVTGESVPADKEPGAKIYAGSLNGEGALVVEATGSAAESTLAKIIHLVEQAQATRAPTQKLVDRFARWYTPAVIALACLLAVLPPLLSGAAWDTWIYRGLVLLVIACPCALVISTPVTMVCGLARAARQGVLIKGGVHLENAGRLRTVVFDKTGTLTQGRMQVEQVVPAEGCSPEELLAVAAALEQQSEHPLAQAIVREARSRGVPFAEISEFEALRGFGVRARWLGDWVYAGSPRMLDHIEPPPSWEFDAFRRSDDQAASQVVVATSQRLLGTILISDRPRPEAAAAVQRLRALGIDRLEMLTGDNQRIARTIAEQLHLDAFHAELLPDEKVQRVHEARNRYEFVAMVGDGVNDAPALAAATVGVSMGAAASDTALETADVTLMSDDLRRMGDLVELGRRTRRIIGQNIMLSLAIKAVFLGLVLIGPERGLMWMAVAADMGASLLVIFNGMRLAVGTTAPTHETDHTEPPGLPRTTLKHT